LKEDYILLIGAGGHAEACIDVIEKEKRYKILGILGLRNQKNKFILNKYKVIGCDDNLTKISKKVKNAIITIGQIKSPTLRINLYKKLKKLKFNLPVIMSPHSVVSNYSAIGEGTIIMHGAIIGANVRIGKNCIINSNSLIEHGSRIGDNTHIATSVTINSGVTVDSNSFIGSNSTLKQTINIGKNSVIGMCQTILKNCPPNSFIAKKNEKK